MDLDNIKNIMNMSKKDFLAKEGLVEYLADVSLNNETYEAIKEYTRTTSRLTNLIVIVTHGDELENMSADELKQFEKILNKELALDKKNIRESISLLAGRFLVENIDTIKSETEQMKSFINEFIDKIQKDQ